MTIALGTVPESTVAAVRRHWDAGWNRGDVDVIMAPFADDVVFSSPFVTRLTGDPGKAEIVGAAALREYCEAALRRTPGIRYTVDDVYTGTESVVLVYRCHLPNGTEKRGADSLRVDADGRVVEWRCHYSGEE